MSVFVNFIEAIQNCIEYIGQLIRCIDMKYTIMLSLIVSIYILLDPTLFGTEHSKKDQECKKEGC